MDRHHAYRSAPEPAYTAVSAEELAVELGERRETVGEAKLGTSRDERRVLGRRRAKHREAGARQVDEERIDRAELVLFGSETSAP